MSSANEVLQGFYASINSLKAELSEANAEIARLRELAQDMSKKLDRYEDSELVQRTIDLGIPYWKRAWEGKS